MFLLVTFQCDASFTGFGVDRYSRHHSRRIIVNLVITEMPSVGILVQRSTVSKIEESCTYRSKDNTGIILSRVYIYCPV